MDERERTIRALLPLVRSLAKRIHRLVPRAEIDDLVGDGSLGAIRAVDGFDPSYGTTLEHYARQLILGKMLNGIRRMDPVAERARREVRDAQRERYQLAGELGNVPTIGEMCARRPRLEAAMRQVREAVPFSLDRRLPDGVDPPLDFSADPARIVHERLESARLREMVETLGTRHRSVIAMHYYDETSLRAIGKRMAVSSQRMSQIHLAALSALREIVRAAD